jgi:peptide deformylase
MRCGQALESLLVTSPTETNDLTDGAQLVRMMADAGVVQRGDPVLTQSTTPWRLPAESAQLDQVLQVLHATAERAQSRYPFHHGMGLAAPQVGVGRRVALVQPAPGEALLELVNPTVVSIGPLDDGEYEGCLSFFGVRGVVARPRWLVVDHASRGAVVRGRFDGRLARLVMHELDHLDGVLYDQRMGGPATVLPVEMYRQVTASRRRGRG